MRGEFQPIWSETWRDIWSPLSKQPDVPKDLFSELYRIFVTPPRPPEMLTFPPETEYDADGKLVRQEDIDARAAYEAALARFKSEQAFYMTAVGGGVASVKAFRQFVKHELPDEAAAIKILETAFAVIDAGGVESGRNRFFLLIEKFIEKFSLRYDLRRPFTLHTTPSGVYTKLYAELANRCRQDAALAALLRDYREAFQDLRLGASSGRINTCLQKQVNLLEGLASLNPAITAKSLGDMCNQVTTWPSSAVTSAVKSLYGFASDHTGLRHGIIKKPKDGKAPVLYRDMELRDLVAVSMFFTGLSAYLSEQIDPQAIYGT